MQNPVLQIDGLGISFRVEKQWVPAVHEVSFSVFEKETLGIVGESGCGKTITALSILRLLQEPPAKIHQGTITYKGKSILELSNKAMRAIRGKDISMIFQEPMVSLNPVFCVGDQIVEAIRLHHRQSYSAAKQQAIQAMHEVGISNPMQRYYDYPHQLSGGMRQRIMIAMALSCQPTVLIADEPTTALDATIQAQILDLITHLQSQTSMSVVLITHDLGIIAEVAHRVAVMYAGTMMEIGEVHKVFVSPFHPYTKALYHSLPQANVKSRQSRLHMIPGRVPVLGETFCGCRFVDRCKEASFECQVSEPSLREIQPNHWVRCGRV